MKYKCNTCAVAADCRKAFGRYWLERSNDGVGCDLRFSGWRPGEGASAPETPRGLPPTRATTRHLFD